jgi:hypothetical protein
MRDGLPYCVLPGKFNRILLNIFNRVHTCNTHACVVTHHEKKDGVRQALPSRDASRIMAHQSTIRNPPMKHPEDQRTIELPLQQETPARRRGRPPKIDTMSDAERARRYRARQKMMPKDEWNYEQVTSVTRAEIERLTGDATARPQAEAELVAQWAYGMFLLWDRVTAQCQRPADRSALLALVTA